MSFFDKISTSVGKSPERILLYGSTGCGKTSAACSFPRPAIIPVELGLDALPDAKRLPQPKKWEDVTAMLDEFISGRSRLPYDSLVVDTLDQLERLCWAYVCRKNYTLRVWKSLETPGYGKGYNEAHKAWTTEFFPRLDTLHDKGIHVVLLAQSMVKTWTNPTGENFDRYQLRLHDKVATVFQEWVADQFFCRHYTGVSVTKSEVTGRKRALGQSTNQRIAHTVWDAAWNAKHRLRVPEEIEMPDPYVGGSFYDALQKARAEGATMAAPIKERTQAESTEGENTEEGETSPDDD